MAMRRCGTASAYSSTRWPTFSLCRIARTVAGVEPLLHNDLAVDDDVTPPLHATGQTCRRGQADRVRIASNRGARRPLRPNVVHRRSGLSEVGGDRACGV